MEKQNEIIIKYLFSIICFLFFLLLVINFLIFVFNIKEIIVSFTQLITGIAGFFTLLLLSYGGFLRFKFDRKLQTQITIQDHTRKDQQFLDTIKLISEDKNNTSKMGGLSILENLARSDENYRQRILNYLKLFTNKIKNENSLIIPKKFTSEEDFIGIENIDLKNNIIKNSTKYSRNQNFIFKNSFEFGSKLNYNESICIELSLTQNNDFKLKFNNEIIILDKKKLIKLDEDKIYYEFKYNYSKIQFYPNITTFGYQFRVEFNNTNENIKKYFYDELLLETDMFSIENLNLMEKILNFEIVEDHLNLDISNIYTPFFNISKNKKLKLKINKINNSTILSK
jgi:hypothetical protein